MNTQALSTNDLETSPLRPFQGFEEAAENILLHLHERLGFDLWMISRTEGEDWIILSALDHGYNVKNGDVFRWTDSLCSRMATGLGPHIAPRTADVPAYTEAPFAKQISVASYIGVPLRHANGDLYGTLCAIDPDPKPVSIGDELPLIQLLAQMLSAMIGISKKEQEAARALERVQEESETDHLTDLYNRRGWDKSVDIEEQRCRRYGNPAGVIIIDLDDLKAVNDLEGHAAGDQLISDAAKALKNAVRPSDVVARIGGDEFAVLAIESSLKNTKAIVERIREGFNAADINASLGWSSRNPRKNISAAQALADKKMYSEKQDRKQH